MKFQQYCLLALGSVFIYPTAFAANSSITKEDLASLGHNFLQVAGHRAEDWMQGRDIIPSLANRGDKVTQNWLLNTDPSSVTDVSKALSKFPTSAPPQITEAIVSKAWSERQDFRKRVGQEIATGAFYDHYNSFIQNARELGCWRQFKEKSEACKATLDYGFGVLIGVLDNRNILAESPISPEKVIRALNEFLHYEGLDPESEIAFQTLRYSFDQYPVALYQIGYRINEKALLFSDFTNGVLSKPLPNIDQNFKTNQLVNLFRIDVDLLQKLLNDRSKEWDLIRGSAARLDQIKFQIKTEFDRAGKGSLQNGFTINDFYSGLGLLDHYYEDQAEYPKLDNLRKFRGDLRASYSEITSSFIERFFLRIWGLVSGYGTEVGTMTLLFALLFFVTIGSALYYRKRLSLSTVAEVLDDVIRIATLRGDQTILKGAPMLLILEFLFALYIPTFLGFLITFMLRAK